jgi:excinuclease ABC subunit A
MGPGAGSLGGRVVATGDPAALESNPASLTGRYLAGRETAAIPARAPRNPRPGLELEGASAHNLKGIAVEIPAGAVTAVSGVSGSGKSSLVFDVIAASFRSGRPVHCRRINGLDRFARIIGIDQSPIGTSPLSTPATYCGLFDSIRELFSKTEAARARGYTKSRFSFNSKGGRCEDCRGAGFQKVEMGFLSDIWIPCEGCGGKRYNDETLAIRFKHKNIYEVLQTTVEDALPFFGEASPLRSPLDILCSVGLGYLALGQPSNTLSGGEAQRLKLAAEMIKPVAAHASPDKRFNLYLFDEPTTGLHFHDVRRLIGVLRALADLGHAVLVVEHNLDVIKSADWIIDLGPEGGDAGGEVIAAGSPPEIMACPRSWTGRALQKRAAGR